jgi:eukaryotic-like serine/threonine-protein kinase
VIAGSMIVVPLQGGAIAAHHLEDGREVWKRELAAEKPLASDNERVYVAAGEAIHALNAATGDVAWRVPAGGAPTAAPLAHAGWLITAAAGDLVAIRATDGQIIWRKQVGAIEFRPAIDGDLLVASLVDGHVIGLNVENGEERWRRNLGSSPAEPLVFAGRVYVGTANKWFYSLRATSGRIDYPLFVGALVMGRPAADERHVYFVALDHLLRALDRGDGALEWKAPLSYRPTAGPLVLGGYVMVAGSVVSLPAFNARTGAAAGTIAFPARLVAIPLLGQSPTGLAFGVAITGSLENKWNVSLFEPSPFPTLPVGRLTELPGEVVVLPTVPNQPKG